jgi:hypothetical protein
MRTTRPRSRARSREEEEMNRFQGRLTWRTVVLTSVAAALLAPTPAGATMEGMMRSDYGYVFMQRDAGCTHEELWTGLNRISTAGLAPGSSWSDPSTTAWAWYRFNNSCTLEEETLYGEAALEADAFHIEQLGDLSFEASFELFEVTSSEAPPFLTSGPTGLGADPAGSVAIQLAFTQEGRIRTFNSINGIVLPPPSQTTIGAPGQRVAWQYTGASIAGSVSGDLNFDVGSIVFAEIGTFTSIEA